MDGRLVAVRGGSPGLLVATPGKPRLLLRALAAALAIYERHTAMARERDGRRTRGEGEEEGSVSTW
jgi:hypothetical protein